MRRVKILRGTKASGLNLEPGKTYDLKEDDALLLMRMNKAVPVEVEPPAVEDREKDLDVTTRAPKKAAPKKATAKKKAPAKKTTKKEVKDANN